MRDLINQLNRLRKRGRAMLVTQRLSVVLTWIVGSLLVLGLADFFMRFPGTIRFLVLVSGLGGLAWSFWRFFAPTLLFQPTLTHVALRVERALPAVAGRLASSVEFEQQGVSRENPLAARSIRDTKSRLAGESLAVAINARRTWRDIGMLAAAFVIVAGVVLVDPTSAGTALSRILVPYGDAQWPARTGVESMVGHIRVHPRGEALALRARVTKGDIDHLDVNARYRLQRDGAPGPWRTIVLAHQPQQGPGICESLVDTDAEMIEVHFYTDDDETEIHVIQLVTPPAVVRASLVVTPPAYASGRTQIIETELGPGIDERAVTDTPALIGSDAVIRFELNKPIPVPTDAQALENWTEETFGWQGDESPRLAVDADEPRLLTLQWRIRETAALSLHLVDDHGIGNVEEIAYQVRAIPDRPPSVTITEPETDQTVIPTAMVALVAEARDDVAVGRVALSARRQTGVDEPPGDPLWAESAQTDAAAAVLETELDLGAVSVSEGDVIEVVGLTDDMYELDGESHATVRSAIRRFRIITELELQNVLRRELQAIRESAIRSESRQAELQDDIIDDGVQPGVQRAQGRIGDRIGSQVEALEEIIDRKEMNRLDDPQLEQLLEDALDVLTEAGLASNQAGELIESRQFESAGDRNEQTDTDRQNDENREADEASDQRDENDADAARDQEGDPAHEDQQPFEPELRQAADEDQPIVDAQQRVRDELTDLIEMLDRNEDSWVITQRTKALLQEQQQLQAETAALNNQTVGRTINELTPDERTELDRISQKQRELEDQAQKLIEDSRTRAEDMAEVDPEGARGVAEAADLAESEELQGNMENAANESQQNQLQNAQQSQQAAIETMQGMLEALDRERARAEELQRRLSSLVESIARLITVQENEISALAKAEFENDYAGRDRAMIRLNQNTQSVAGEARAAGQRASRIARTLDRAADAQGAVVGYLRSDPIRADDADSAENRSLELLKEAEQLAKELQEQLQQEESDRKKQELIVAYRDLMEREVALRRGTLDIAQQGELDRRALVEARRLSNVQEDIRSELTDIQDRTDEIADSIVFSHVHQMIDDWADSVHDSLREGDVSVLVTDQQQMIAQSIAELIKALEDSQSDQSPFEDESGSGGGSGGSGEGGGEQPLIPPIAELKLLRGLQDHIYRQTRHADAREDLDAAERRQTLRDLGRRQNELSDLGQQMLDALSPPGGPPPSEVPQSPQ